MFGAKRLPQIVVLLAVLAAYAVAAGAETTVTVREKADVEGSMVLVGDVAEIGGVSEDERKRIEGLKFGLAPQPGKEISYKAAQVKGRLDGFLMWPGGLGK